MWVRWSLARSGIDNQTSGAQLPTGPTIGCVSALDPGQTVGREADQCVGGRARDAFGCETRQALRVRLDRAYTAAGAGRAFGAGKASSLEEDFAEGHAYQVRLERPVRSTSLDDAIERAAGYGER